MLRKSQILNLNNFRKLSTLDRGSFGVVLQVQEIETGKIFAAKIQDIRNNEKTNLPHEIQILQLDHPAINKFIGFCPFDFDNQSRSVIITEFCSNRTLKDIFALRRNIQSFKLWTNTKKLINIYGIASAMLFLHSHNIIHLDLKPSNILEDDHLCPQISDFGISLQSNEKPIFDSADGTPAYSAPEVIAGISYTTAADVYSFSLIIYEILTNESPFQGLKTFEILNKVVQQGYRPNISSKSIPNCYKNLISRCWSQDPKQRPNFNEIVLLLKNNKEFISGFSIDDTEYFNYIDYIDVYLKNPNSNESNSFKEKLKKVSMFPPMMRYPISLNVKPVDLTKYEKQERIGEDSFSVVYEVLNKENGKKYAAKILKKEIFECFQDDDEAVNLRREVTNLQRLNHPAIAKFVGYSPVSFDKAANPVVLTEFQPNRSLDTILDLDKNGFAPEFWNDTKKLINIYGIASSMAYVHSRNILHRNLKPSSILIDELIHPKLSDFWFSKSENEKGESFKRKDETPILGTFVYIAPEVFSKLEYSRASDVYAFAMIVYEILTNEKPFLGSTVYQVMMNVMNGFRPNLNTPKVPDCFKKLIQDCWSHDPKKRPSFDSILHIMKTDKSFISESVRNEEFSNYVNSIDTMQGNFSYTRILQRIDFNSIYDSQRDDLAAGGFVNLNNFQEKKKIQIDGYSSIYEITSKSNGSLFCAKESSIEINNLSKEEKDCLTKDVNYISQLNHPSLLHFVGYSSVDFKNIHKPVVVTEYAPYKTLEDFIDVERNGLILEGWNATKKLITIYGIASCMSYLHSRNILHYNLKPSNVIIDDHLHPKLSEFGFYAQNQMKKCLQMQSIYGMNENPAYSIPDTFICSNFTRASDVYSFSLIVYEMITGEKPFSDMNNSIQVINDVVNSSRRPQFKSPIPSCYKELIEICWSQDPNERPTFDKILDILKTDPRFLSPQVNKQEFFEFIYFHLKDYELELLNKAASRNDPLALFNLGLLYSKGISVPLNKQKAVELYERSASLGNARAQFNLGLMYLKGDGVPQNKPRAIELFESASNQGDPKAQFNLGVMYFKGDSVPQSYDKAIELYELAASQGDSEALVNLGLMYDQGEGVEVDKRKAFEMYSKSAVKGNGIAQFNLAIMYQKGLEGVLLRDNRKAAQLYQLAADQGIAQAQFNLGVLYSKGADDFPSNEDIARQLFEKAASQGYSDAMFNLAMLYMKDNKAKMVELLMLAAERNNPKALFQLGILFSKGDIVQKDMRRSVEYYTRAANMNYKEAKFNLGVVYFKGSDGIPQDKKRAAELFEEIADTHPRAIFNLAIMYTSGNGVPRDVNKGLFYYEKAAKLDNDDALLNLGVIYNEGSYGVVPDQPKAFQCYKRAADLGNTKAQANLGFMYQKGIGCQVDKTKAKLYYKMSADQGNDQAQLNLALLLLEGNNLEQMEAMKYLTLAANHGNAEAMFYLARKYQQNEDMKNAIKYFELSAQIGFPKSQCELGKIYLNGEGTPKNINKAEQLLEIAASQDVNEALIYLADLRKKKSLKSKSNSMNVIFGNIESKIQSIHNKVNKEPYVDFTTSLNDITSILTDIYLTQYITANTSINKTLKNINDGFTSQHQHHITSQPLNKNSLPSLNNQPTSPHLTSQPSQTEDDLIEEITKLKIEVKSLETRLSQTAKQVESPRNTPTLPLESDISGLSTSSALLPESVRVKRIMEKAEDGDAKAQLHLAAYYATGKGVEASSTKAFEYYMLSAEQGNANAQYAAGTYLYYGRGTNVNKRKALDMFRRAAESGHMKAQFAMGQFFECEKEKSAENRMKAAAWYRKAAEQGHERAAQILRDEFNENV